MNLNYAIFRSKPIHTIPDLAQIGLHEMLNSSRNCVADELVSWAFKIEV